MMLNMYQSIELLKLIFYDIYIYFIVCTRRFYAQNDVAITGV